MLNSRRWNLRQWKRNQLLHHSSGRPNNVCGLVVESKGTIADLQLSLLAGEVLVQEYICSKPLNVRHRWRKRLDCSCPVPTPVCTSLGDTMKKLTLATKSQRVVTLVLVRLYWKSRILTNKGSSPSWGVCALLTGRRPRFGGFSREHNVDPQDSKISWTNCSTFKFVKLIYCG